MKSWLIGSLLALLTLLALSIRPSEPGTNPGKRDHVDRPGRDGPSHAPIPRGGSGMERPPACATGCAAAPRTVDSISDASLADWIAQYAREPMSEDSPALETLLFHVKRARRYLARHEDVRLDAERLDFLRRELAVRDAFLDVRIIDETGRERVRLGETRLPLGERTHMHAARVDDIQAPEITGTVERVGVRHLWARL